MKSKCYNSLDITKLIMSFCVVAIHTHPLENCSNKILLSIYETFVSNAVPFFFIASGFLLSLKLKYPFSNNESICQIKQYFKRMIKLYSIWTLIYFPMAVYHFIDTGVDLAGAVLIYIKGFIFAGEQYNSWPLWYLLSTIYALIFILFLLQIAHQSPERIIYFGVVMFITGTLISYLLNFDGELSNTLIFLKKIFQDSMINGRIFSGAFYIPVGMMLGKTKINRKLASIVLPVVFILNVGKKIIGINSMVATVMSSLLTAACTISLFLVVIDLHLPNSKAYPFVRKMSTVIYFIHMYVWTAYYMIAYGKKTHGLDSFIATVGITIIIAFFYVYFSSSRATKGHLGQTKKQVDKSQRYIYEIEKSEMQSL